MENVEDGEGSREESLYECGIVEIDEMAESMTVGVPTTFATEDFYLNTQVERVNADYSASSSASSLSYPDPSSASKYVEHDSITDHTFGFHTLNATSDRINKLRVNLHNEMQRRMISSSTVAIEASLFTWGRGDEAIHTFLTTSAVENTNQAVQFYNLIQRLDIF